MILLTGAAGKTGKAILHALGANASNVRAFVRSESQAAELKALGVANVFLGDMTCETDLQAALRGIDRLYFISPNMSSDELEIGTRLIQAAREQGVSHFVYHSVMHPQIESMPHHWQKMRMEEALINSNLNFTILQPCAYMQNVLANWQQVKVDGVFAVPYSVEARINMVSLEDVGAVAARVLTETNHSNAIYELSGPESLSQKDVAVILSKTLGKPITAVAKDRHAWAEKASLKLGKYEVDTLLKMFEYYDLNGLKGNPLVLRALLGREPVWFEQFVEQFIRSEGR
jgi:uncharacterized protein YbjT (DUF2867 family)